MSTEIKKVSELSDAELDSVGAGQWRQQINQTQTQTNSFSGPVAVSGFGSVDISQLNQAAQSATNVDDVYF